MSPSVGRTRFRGPRELRPQWRTHLKEAGSGRTYDSPAATTYDDLDTTFEGTEIQPSP